MKRYHIKKVFESSHFVYYANKRDSSSVAMFDSVLNANFDRICKDFNHVIKRKISIEIYPDRISFRKAAGYKDGYLPEAFANAHFLGRMQFTSPIYKEYHQMVSVIQHELAHTVMYDFVGKKKINEIPFWLGEGFAEREADWNTLTTRGQWFILDNIDSITSFETFDNNIKFLALPYGYLWARQLCDFIIDTKGMNAINDLSVNPDHFEMIVGKSKEKFYKEAVTHLKEISKKCLFCSGYGMNDSLLRSNRQVFDKKYSFALAIADSSFKAGLYDHAIRYYEESLLYGYQYSPMWGLQDSNKKIDRKTRRMIYDYNIMKADRLFTEKDFSCAKQYYLFATYFFPDEVYPKDKIMECDSFQKH